jgi:hypothetical protein
MPQLKANSITIAKFVGLALFFCLIFAPPALADTPISCGEIVTGSALKDETVTIYSFSANANDVIGIRAGYSWANGSIQLYGPDNAKLAEASNKIDWTIASTGTYRIFLTSQRSGSFPVTGRYSLGWNRFNNPIAPSIYPCQPGGSTTLSEFKELSFYSFYGEANDKCYIRIQGAPVEIYSPQGAFLGTGDNFTLTLPASGRYTIVVLGRGAFISLTKLNSPCGTTINPGQTIPVILLPNEFMRTFKINAFVNDQISITYVPISFHANLMLFSPDGTLLAEKINSTQLSGIRINTAGTYTLLVEKNTSWQATGYSPDYTIRFTKTNTPPSAVSITPASGGTQAEQDVNFLTIYSDTDPAGYQGIRRIYLLINTLTSGKSCFWGYYDREQNKLYLRDDNDTGWLGSISPGSNTFIENSFARINTGKTTVSGAGQTLTVNWSINFKPAFGNKTYNLYLKADDDMETSSGWVQKGTFRVDYFTIATFLPADKTTFTEGGIIKCSVTVSPTGTYQYQFLVNNSIKRVFDTANTWNWQTSAQDTGLKTLTVQVKNQYGSVINGSRKLFIYRKPIDPK